ncbi:galactose-specific lectin nattectin-like isoform X2 [Phyllopteryx taeniolatus]|uniref:galactose-specific lectin nattectin-like isoform X2 n=1 Tax=Phyllopteryx taeniolatus TaxID=161469 RepID=UPI002AD2BFE6|nr:galactose-specific lectin nattectin-like isoform X2 [Phyllopteryx taeniolatus]
MSMWAQAGSTSKSDRCPEGWTQLNNRCYIYKNESLTFEHAECACKLLGGNLVSIRTNLQSVVVNELIDAPVNVSGVWIGPSNIEDKTIWTDEASGEWPDVGCLEIQTNGLAWDLTNCNTRQPYVCARDVLQCVSICKGDQTWH